MATSDYLRLDLTQAQCDAISAHTPFRFRTITVPRIDEPTATESLIEPYLPLPLTSSPALILSPQRPTDVQRITDTLSRPEVGMQLIGPPWPFKEEDARSWGDFLNSQAQEIFGDLKRMAEREEEEAKPVTGGAASNDAASGKAAAATKAKWPVPKPSLHSLRRLDTDEWVGDFGVTRWQFVDVANPDERKRLADENDAKDPLDPTVVWTFGYYLHPELHGNGRMALVLRSMIDNYFDGFLEADEIRGGAYATNLPSIRTQEKCGLVQSGTHMVEVSEGRGGGLREEVILRRWRVR